MVNACYFRVDPQFADGIYNYLLIENTDGRIRSSSSRVVPQLITSLLN